jgi:two-component system, NtrC family, sensor kinase
MPAAPIPENEELRLTALREYDILDTPPEASFDRITRLACRLLNVPMSVVSLVDKERQWFKSCVGIDVTETPRSPSFCSYTILSDQVLNVPDATQDPRFYDSALVTGSPFLRFYLGIPLRSSSGFNIGSFCAMSPEPRTILESELVVARELAAIVSTELELKLALKHLRQNHAQVLHLEKMSSIGQLSAGVAHEINTPMQFLGDNTHFLKDSFFLLKSLISSYEDLVKTARDDGAYVEKCKAIMEKETEADLSFLSKEIPSALDQSLDGISRVTNLVSAMKTFAHPGEDKKKFANLNKGIEATVTISHNQWKYCSELVTELAGDLPSIPCLISELNQVVLNMIVNATHSIEDAIAKKLITRGLIRIKTSRVENNAVIDFEDNGMGIPKAIINKIFDPFFTTKKVGKGTGQGLAISYDIIVNKHGGSVHITSEPEKGASFRILLPLEEANSLTPSLSS